MSGHAALGEPATDAMDVFDGKTTVGAPAATSLQHLNGLLAALEPLRAAYAAAAVDRLRALPPGERRSVLPHLLREHPELAREPRLRALAQELRIDVEQVDGTALARAMQGLRAHARAATDAARHAAQAVAASDEMRAREARADVPRWWPSPFREAALWTRWTRETPEARQARHRAAYDAAFAHAYASALEAGGSD